MVTHISNLILLYCVLLFSNPSLCIFFVFQLLLASDELLCSRVAKKPANLEFDNLGKKNLEKPGI